MSNYHALIRIKFLKENGVFIIKINDNILKIIRPKLFEDKKIIIIGCLGE